MILDLMAAAQSGGFDVDAATRVYLDTLQGAARAKSDAYFEGGYWLILWGALVGFVVDGLLLRFRLSARFRDVGERFFRRPFPIAWVTALLYTLVGWVLLLPWTIYTGFIREKQYDLMSMGFGGWFGEQATDLAIGLALQPLLIALIYLVIRKAPRRWWLWGAGVVVVFAAIGMLIAPVYIAPLFNTYTEMPSGPLRDKIVAMAGKYDIPADHIYVFDQSKQHKRISANVSGIGPTIRISLNDNLLNRTSEPEIMAVMAHEMGHYKLNHVWYLLGFVFVLFASGLFIVSRLAPMMIARWGSAWGVRDVADPASMPVLGILLGAFFLLATPAFNTMVRVDESAADAFGLDAARAPDGFARVAMRLSEYRKIEPGPVEEFLFFDHPSGATRVRMAMQWKKDHVPGATIEHPPAGYLGEDAGAIAKPE